MAPPTVEVMRELYLLRGYTVFTILMPGVVQAVYYFSWARIISSTHREINEKISVGLIGLNIEAHGPVLCSHGHVERPVNPLPLHPAEADQQYGEAD